MVTIMMMVIMTLWNMNIQLLFNLKIFHKFASNLVTTNLGAVLFIEDEAPVVDEAVVVVFESLLLLLSSVDEDVVVAVVVDNNDDNDNDNDDNSGIYIHSFPQDDRQCPSQSPNSIIANGN